MDKYFKWKVLLILAVVGFSIWAVYPPQEKVHLGLDLKGGIHLLLEVEVEKIPEKQREGAVDRAIEIIRNRIDEFGVKEPTIIKQGKNQIVVQLPGLTDQDRARDIVSKTAHLEFKLVSDDPKLLEQATGTTPQPETKEENQAVAPVVTPAVVPAGYEVKELEEEGALGQTILLHKEPVLTGDRLMDAAVGFDQYGQAVVEFQLDKEGAKTFDDATFRNIGKRLAIVLDGKVHSAPVIRDRIPGGKGQISGNFTTAQASDLALVLRAGALPAPVLVVEQRVVGPSLGQDSIRSGIYASIGGVIFVVVFMTVYYHLSGLIASFAVLLNFIISLGIMDYMGASLTLPGIAGLILTVGMAVDANVLVNERMREEKKLGKTTRAVISAGYHKAFTAILDTHVTTILAALILLQFGSGPLKGFSVTLAIGLAASLFTSIFVTRVIFDYLTSGKKDVKLSMLDLIPTPTFDWIGKRFVGYAFSLAMVAIGIFGIVTKGPHQLGLDFTGGTVEEVHLVKVVDLGEIRSSLKKHGIEEAELQNYGPPEDQNILIRTKSESVTPIRAALTELLGEGQFEVRRSDALGPAAGQELFKKAVKAISFALLIMLGYLAWRFNLLYGICSIIPLLHDVAVSLGLFFLSGREFSLQTVAAVLTIIGYSVNDTVVTFDRVREDARIYRKEKLGKVVNLSINQTFGRTIITSTTTIFGALALFLFGGPALNDFAFILLVGFISGVYSTIFVAGPLAVDFSRK